MCAVAAAQPKLRWWIALLPHNAVGASPTLDETPSRLHSRHRPPPSDHSTPIPALGRSSLKPIPISFETSAPQGCLLLCASVYRSPNSPADTDASSERRPLPCTLRAN